ncbi:MAG: DUF5050 domain-containing protein [Defluviitaleaceae bacterium]|nr:DUF5050 domain-containing protein [Defluviitaleaceae bacterium]
MPLNIDVKPYVLTKTIGGDNYLTNYAASGADGEEFVITEFFPSYMSKRADDGTLEVSERFTREFTDDLEMFVKRAQGFQEIRDASLHPVVEIFERNHTAYIVRRACSLTTVDQYMGSQSMDYDEAYAFIRPLLLSMAQAAEKGVMFTINNGDFRVNAFKQLVLAAPLSWETDFHAPLTHMVKLYYRLVTGSEASHGAPPFSAFGLEVPPRIESLVMEILGGDVLFGSLDDFYKRFKSLIDGGNVEVDPNEGKTTLAIMKVMAASLFVLLALGLCFLAFGAVNAYRTGTFWANPEIFASAEAPSPPIYDLSAVTLTHPRNPADALSGSFGTYEGFLFFRGEQGMKSRLFGDVVFIPGAMGVLALSDDRLILPDVVPSFIVGHDRRIYFVDSASDGAIYRSTTIGENLTRITDHAALNLTVLGDYLYYTRIDHNHNLYRINLRTNAYERVLPSPVFATASSDSHLFYLTQESGRDTLSLYAWYPSYPEPAGTLRQLSTNVGSTTLRIFNNQIFFIDTNGQVRSMSFDGAQIATFEPENVRTFDIFFQWLVFTEEGRHVPRAYNMDNGRLLTLSTTEWVSYIWTYDEQIYALDHRNPNLIHHLEISW